MRGSEEVARGENGARRSSFGNLKGGSAVVLVSGFAEQLAGRLTSLVAWVCAFYFQACRSIVFVLCSANVNNSFASKQLSIMYLTKWPPNTCGRRATMLEEVEVSSVSIVAGFGAKGAPWLS